MHDMGQKAPALSFSSKIEIFRKRYIFPKTWVIIFILKGDLREFFKSLKKLGLSIFCEFLFFYSNSKHLKGCFNFFLTFLRNESFWKYLPDKFKSRPEVPNFLALLARSDFSEAGTNVKLKLFHKHTKF